MAKIPSIKKHELFITGTAEEKKAAIMENLQKLGKPVDAVEYRIVCHIALFGDKDILDLSHSDSEILIKHCNKFTIIPLWENYLHRFGYWTLRYYNQLSEPTQNNFNKWIDSLEEPMKSKFEADGFEECIGVLSFQRFVLELRGYNMDEYLEKNMSRADWKEYKSLKKEGTDLFSALLDKIESNTKKFTFLFSPSENWTDENWQALYDLFNEQYPNIPTGGFHNPSFDERIYEGTEDEIIMFKCYYDNFENEDDCWFWGLDRDLNFETY